MPDDDQSETAAHPALGGAKRGVDIEVSGLALQGADAANYRIADPSARASISARALSLSQTKIADKVYDGTTAASLAGEIR